MAEILHARTSTLQVKLPADLYVPPFQDKIRARKGIVKTIIHTLQTKQLELIYVGLQSGLMNLQDAAISEGVVVSVNILNDAISNFNASPEMLLKRFKRELQHNHEHILIDNTIEVNGKTLRTIEIYIRSRHADKVIVPAYPFAVSSGSYEYSVA
ncbi:MAG TPA: hypothetical protein VGB50_01015 [Flavobacterium sp.]|jgi:hypothetical protein